MQQSHYSGTFAKPRANEVETPPRHHAIPLPDKLQSYAPGNVVQMDTMYVRTPSNRFWYQVYPMVNRCDWLLKCTV